MEDQPEKANHGGDGNNASGLKMKSEPTDVDLDEATMEQEELEHAKVKIEEANDELMYPPSTSGASKHLVILKRGIKRRSSEDQPFDDINKAVKMEVKDEKKPFELPAIQKEESVDQNPGNGAKIKPKNEAKDEVKEEPIVKAAAKPLIGLQNEIKNEDNCSLNPRRTPNTERIKIENERKFEGVLIGRRVKIKPDPDTLMKVEVKGMKLLKMKKEEAVDQKPDIQLKFGMKIEIKAAFKDDMADKGGEQPLIGLKLKTAVKKEEIKQKRAKMETFDQNDVNGSTRKDLPNSQQNQSKESETESVCGVGSSAVAIDANDEMSQAPADISPPSTSSAVAAPEAEEIQCRHCKKMFPSEAICKKHIREKCKKRHKCRICNKRFARPSELKIHLRIHLDEKPFICGVNGCEKRFCQEGNVVRHRRTHSGERPFACKYENCGKAFAVSGSLVVHKRTHTGERSYICNIAGCGKGFVHSGNLVVHKRLHAGEKNFVCDYEGCGKAFAQRGALLQHNQTHTKEKRLTCEYEGCGKRFSYDRSLVHHRRIHQREI